MNSLELERLILIISVFTLCLVYKDTCVCKHTHTQMDVYIMHN